MTIAQEATAGRTLLPASMFNRLAARVATDQGVAMQYAGRIMDQALAFLGAVALHPQARLVPSSAVDAGWHVVLLYTREYSEFCFRLAGRFLHHVPDDGPDAPVRAEARETGFARTIAAIERAGYRVDQELWEPNGQRCGTCHEDGNCPGSGVDGNENTETRKQ